MINVGIKIIDTHDMGLGLMANRLIKAGEWVADWTGGTVHRAKSRMRLPRSFRDHAIQFAPDRWIDVRTGARLINHSCDPNCGMLGLFTVVAMRDVSEGEALSWDYEMSENSDWRMHCRCGSPLCRGVIGAYANMPQHIRRKYGGFTSPWLTQLKECAPA